MSETGTATTSKPGDRASCANCGASIVFRYPESHVRGFWVHDDDEFESYEPQCRLFAKPVYIGSDSAGADQ